MGLLFTIFFINQTKKVNFVLKYILIKKYTFYEAIRYECTENLFNDIINNTLRFRSLIIIYISNQFQFNGYNFRKIISILNKLNVLRNIYKSMSRSFSNVPTARQ